MIVIVFMTELPYKVFFLKRTPISWSMLCRLAWSNCRLQLFGCWQVIDVVYHDNAC